MCIPKNFDTYLYGECLSTHSIHSVISVILDFSPLSFSFSAVGDSTGRCLRDKYLLFLFCLFVLFFGLAEC